MKLGLKKNARKTRNAYRVTRSRKNRQKNAESSIAAAFTGFWRKIGNVSRLKGILLVGASVLGGGVVLAGICAISLCLYNAAVTSDFFLTRHVDVSGNVRLSRDMVLQYGGIAEGSNSLAVNIAKVERGLRETPWVEEVSVKRLLPDRFVIKLKERMPSFWVRKDGILYYANERGKAIAPVESKNFLSLPILRMEAGSEDTRMYLPLLLQAMRNGALPVELGALASITLSPGRGIEIYLEEREMRLSIATDDWDGNLFRMGLTLDDLARRHELGSVREVRAVNDSVWVVLTPAA
jgi:cell division protein FtsQ